MGVTDYDSSEIPARTFRDAELEEIEIHQDNPNFSNGRMILGSDGSDTSNYAVYNKAGTQLLTVSKKLMTASSVMFYVKFLSLCNRPGTGPIHS